MRKIFLTAVALVSLSGIARAEDKGPPMPKPAPELEQLKIFMGTHKCDMTLSDPSGKGEMKTVMIVKIKPAADGFWHAVEGDMKKTKGFPGHKFTGYWGWDSAGKQFWRALVGNDGGWDMGTSKGWEGDKFVWTGETVMMGQKAPFKHTFTKDGTNVMDEFQIQMGGAWKTFGKSTCKK